MKWIVVFSVLVCLWVTTIAKKSKLKLHQDSFVGHTFQLVKDKSHRNVTWDALFFKSQVQVLFSKEWQRIQECSPMASTVHILDMGCGPGYFARELVKQNPNFQITCMDIDPIFVEYTKQVNQQVLHPEDEKRITVVQGSIFETNLPAHSFDLITIRFVLQHLRYQYVGEDNPIVIALQEMKRLVKPNGKIFVEDSDAFYPDIINPVVKSVEKLETKFNQLEDTLRSQHSDFFLTKKYHHASHGRVGTDLFALLQRAQFSQIQIDSVLVHSDQFEDKMAKFLPMIHPYNYYSLVVLKKVSQKEFDRAVADFEEIFQNSKNNTTQMEGEDPLKPFMAIFTQTACAEVTSLDAAASVKLSSTPIGYDNDVIAFSIPSTVKIVDDEVKSSTTIQPKEEL